MGPEAFPANPLLAQLLRDAERILGTYPYPDPEDIPAVTPTPARFTPDHKQLSNLSRIVERMVDARFSGFRAAFQRPSTQVRAVHNTPKAVTRFEGRLTIQVPFSVEITDEYLARVPAQVAERDLTAESVTLAEDVVTEIKRKLALGAATPAAPTQAVLKDTGPAEPIPAMPFDKD